MREIYSSQTQRQKVEWQLPGAPWEGREELLMFNEDRVSIWENKKTWR